MITNPSFDFETFPVLETARCRLRRITNTDADAIIALYNDPEVIRYLIVDPPCDNHERAIEMIQWMENWYTKKEALRWGITLRENDALIGTCGFHFWSKEHRRVDIGFDLLPSYWNKGYMTEITHVMLRWCFVNLDLHRIQADCTAGNMGSERVLLKCGFTYEGTWRENTFEHGQFVSLKQFGLLRREHLKE